MKIFWFLLYNCVFFPFFYLGLRVSSIFSAKIRKGILARKGLFENLKDELAKLPAANSRVWFHCASLGEFEQAKPMIAKFKQMHRNVSIIVSFFSSSGYDNVGNYPLVDIVCYLPFDSLRGTIRFLRLLRPRLAVIVKHDLWPNQLWALRSCKIPTVLINGTLPENSKVLLPGVRSFYRSILPCFDIIFAASEGDAERYREIGQDLVKIMILGDSRYDQAYRRSLKALKEKIIPGAAIANRRVFLAGSTWPSDERYLFPAFEKLIQKYETLMMILVPHEPTPKRVKGIEKHFTARNIPISKLSQLKEQANAKVILVDRVGVLASLYALSEIAYVGGSFEPGVHNVLEPAIFGNPVLFGPKILNSAEAQALVARGAGFVVKDEKEIFHRLSLAFENPSLLKELSDKARSLVLENLGTTERIFPYLEEYLQHNPLRKP